MTATEEQRDRRDFDLEAQRRHKKLFVGLMIGFAVLAAMAGVVLAWWIISPPPEPAIPPPKPPPVGHPPPPEPGPTIGPPETTKPPPGPTLRRALTKKDLNRGMARLRSALDACAREYGAIDGTIVMVDFAVGPSGRVEVCEPTQQHRRTPLGRCVADVIASKGRFARSREGLRDIHRTVKLRRPDLK